MVGDKMIQVYQAKREEFEFNGDMILSPMSCVLKTTLNGDIYLELEHPYDEEGRWEFLVEGNLIKAPYPFKDDQLFRIYEIEKSLESIVCQARHIFFDLADEVLLDVRPTNQNGQGALNQILSHTKFKGISDISTVRTAYYIRKAIAHEVLISDDENSFINRWGGELDVDNFKVYFNKRCGGDYGVSFIYGKNLTGIEATINLDDVVTRIIPVGYDGITIPEGYVDSPYISQYPTIKSKVMTFSHIKVKTSEASDDGYETLELAQEALREACRDLYEQGQDQPTINMKIEVAHLEHLAEYEGYESLLQVGLGDTVSVYHEGLGIHLETRVISYQYDCLVQKYTSIELGDSQPDFLSQQFKTQQVIQQITNSDGSINAEKVKGFLNAMNTTLTAQRDIAQKQHVRAIIFEDLDPNSPTYGCCALGTAGLEVSHRRSSDGRGWIFDTAITGQGIVADAIVTGSIWSKDGRVELNLDAGYLKFSHHDGSYTMVNVEGFNRYVNNTKKSYHYLFHQTTQTGLNMNCGTYHSYQMTLPDEFKGKTFLPTCAFKRCAFLHSPGSLTEFEAAISNIDYTNATFTLTVYAQGIVFNQTPGTGSLVNTSVSKKFSFEVVCTVVA